MMRDTTLAERRRNRIGNNFYLAGYLCPKCGSQLYMAVYPEGREFQIETEEGAVRIARVTVVKSAVACIRQDQSVCWWMGMYTKWTLNGMRLPMRIIRNFGTYCRTECEYKIQ